MIRNCKEVTLSGKQYEIDDTSGCINKSSPCLVDLGRADCGDCPPLKSSVAMASPVGTGDYDDDLQRANVTSCIGEEIPVWIRGEVRWISGVTYETTCTDIIQALLTAEGIQTSAGVDELNTPELSDFVITERWREMEQVLDGNMSILKIWMAWGETQSEVRLTLRRVEYHQPIGDHDSGRGSPTLSVNSAIVRRRRHKASKTTMAWATQAQTIHPKSQKSSSIERLMKLILEQGETIQQQLLKLRDKEMQIMKIEEDRHRHREKEHGKNYLLETYLKGLSELKDSTVASNSDSGVPTEEATSSASPVSAEHQSDKASDDIINNSIEQKSTEIDKMKTSDTSNVAEQIELLENLVIINKQLQRQEEQIVRLNAKIRRYQCNNPALNETEIREALDKVNTDIKQNGIQLDTVKREMNLSDEILLAKTNMLECLQTELEYLDRVEPTDITTVNEISTPLPTGGLNQNENVIRSYPFEPITSPTMTTVEVLGNPESTIEPSRTTTVATTNPNVNNDDTTDTIASIPIATNPSDGLTNKTGCLNLSREYLAENIYNISKSILKTNYLYNSNNDLNLYQSTNGKTNNSKCVPATVYDGNAILLDLNKRPLPYDNNTGPMNSYGIEDGNNSVGNNIPSTLSGTDRLVMAAAGSTPVGNNTLVTTATIHTNGHNRLTEFDGQIQNPNQMYYKMNTNNININKLNQRYGTNAHNELLIADNNVKLVPKKLLLNSIVIDTNSDTGVSSLGEDVSQLGTLV